MSKLLRIRDYILISAAIGADIFDEIRLMGNLLPSIMQTRYGYVPNNYKKGSYYNKVSKMISVGDIKREHDEKGRSYLVLTSAGIKKYKRRFRIYYKRYKWDGYFMVAVFDIEEKNRKTRDFIRSKLRELGFGMLQQSVWISPYHFEDDLKELIDNYGLSDNVIVFSAKKLTFQDRGITLNKIWNLGVINNKYKRVIKLISKVEKTSDKRLFNKAINIYMNTLKVDPLLPDELLPKNWLREKAHACINNLKTNIYPHGR